MVTSENERAKEFKICAVCARVRIFQKKPWDDCYAAIIITVDFERNFDAIVNERRKTEEHEV